MVVEGVKVIPTKLSPLTKLPLVTLHVAFADNADPSYTLLWFVAVTVILFFVQLVVLGDSVKLLSAVGTALVA